LLLWSLLFFALLFGVQLWFMDGGWGLPYNITVVPNG
jgi:hypothetical protein